MTKAAAMGAGLLVGIAMIGGLYLTIANLLGYARLPCAIGRPAWLGLTVIVAVYSGVRVYVFHIPEEEKARRQQLRPELVRIQNVLTFFYVAFVLLFAASAIRAC